ncbi:DUF4280 domain-containing protein [Chryseobacterium sp. SSA4.19]|uniref:DUF4280 domain-containing protein n=1 Tax=Chryseobacterium sp. SSA4.19 TaxID=2919915 RepID=UPI001F4E9CA0|nr:DUF4280 domain-containing protein [Chryseobacterium sp. SSA4.19]MCJ8154200.1 DUF4280 domain-containing protein [Chryseobacterium sp. SSA4.19]
MPQKITHTAQLSCSQGTTPSNLSVTSQNFSTAEGKHIATEQDKQANTNIKPFGQCKLKPTSGGYLPCIPAPIIWQKTTEKDTINNYKILTEDSFCMCAIGGKIEIAQKGHDEEHNIS